MARPASGTRTDSYKLRCGPAASQRWYLDLLVSFNFLGRPVVSKRSFIQLGDYPPVPAFKPFAELVRRGIRTIIILQIQEMIKGIS